MLTKESKYQTFQIIEISQVKFIRNAPRFNVSVKQSAIRLRQIETCPLIFSVSTQRFDGRSVQLQGSKCISAAVLIC